MLLRCFSLGRKKRGKNSEANRRIEEEIQDQSIKIKDSTNSPTSKAFSRGIHIDLLLSMSPTT